MLCGPSASPMMLVTNIRTPAATARIRTGASVCTVENTGPWYIAAITTPGKR